MPRVQIRLIAAILALLPAIARAQTPAPSAPLPSVALPPELDRVLRDYERAWQASDPAAVAALFTTDGFVLSNGKPAVRGRDAIRSVYQGAGGQLRLRAFAYAVQDTVGYVIGGYRYGADSSALDSGKFILALRRASGGQWLIAGDIDNSNRR